MQHAIDYRQKVLSELAEIPEEFIPFVFQQIKAYRENLNYRKESSQSPAQRLLDLAGCLENPDGLSAKQYKKRLVDEYLSQTL